MSAKSYEYNKKYAEEYLKNFEEVKIRVPLGGKDKIKERASGLGISVNAYIIELISCDLRQQEKENRTITEKDMELLKEYIKKTDKGE